MSHSSKEKKLVTDVWTLRSFPHYGNSCCAREHLGWLANVIVGDPGYNNMNRWCYKCVKLYTFALRVVQLTEAPAVHRPRSRKSSNECNTFSLNDTCSVHRRTRRFHGLLPGAAGVFSARSAPCHDQDVRGLRPSRNSNHLDNRHLWPPQHGKVRTTWWVDLVLKTKVKRTLTLRRQWKWLKIASKFRCVCVCVFFLFVCLFWIRNTIVGGKAAWCWWTDACVQGHVVCSCLSWNRNNTSTQN
jgi:hypothetical protein